MYLAELHGKLSPKVERMEDILTSNVFSFFKYSRRDIFLKGYLNELGLIVSKEEAEEAEFLFWSRFEDKTEPDLIIVVGDYYLLIETKYFSGFADETQKTKAQLQRELDGGRSEAKNYGKQFYLVVVTADSYKKEEKFKAIPLDLRSYCIWTNWQTVSWFLFSVLESHKKLRREELEFVSDLYNLLDKKNLRGFKSFSLLGREDADLKTRPLISLMQRPPDSVVTS